MADFDWRGLLEELNSVLLEDKEICDYAPSTDVSAGWFGCPPATIQEIRAAESRLEISYPPSYRQFLTTSNGWSTTGWESIALHPASDVEWLRNRDPKLIEIWSDPEEADEVDDCDYFVYGEDQDCTNIRWQYLNDMLLISTRCWANQDYFFLNPNVVFAEEWEAWHFSSEFPGAVRYRSFYDLMLAELESVRSDRS